MRKLKVAIIGLAHVHAQCLYRDFNKYPEQIEWLGCADVPPFDEKGVENRIQMNLPNGKDVKIYDDYKTLLDLNPDIALICTDIKGHADIVEETLARNIHTVVEKPMATTIEEGIRMYRADKKSNATLVINWPVAWFASFRKAYELVKSGVIGIPLRFHYRSPATWGPYDYGKYSAQELSEMWWYQHERGGGSIMDYAGYGCLLPTWFLGGMAERVSGMKKNFLLPFSDVEDYSTFTLDFGNSIGLIEGSWSTLNNGEIPTGPVIYGSEGTIVADRYSNQVKVYKQISHQSTEADAVYDVEDLEEDIARNVIEHIHHGTPVHELISVEFNLKVMAALDAGIRSCKSGNIETVKNPFQV
mgnify:CR=1 FL=1